VTEDNKRVWDVRLGMATPVLTVVTLLVGVWQFNHGEENRVRLESQLLKDRDTREYHRKLFQERLSTYRAIAEIAGGIAAQKSKDKKLQELTESFMAQYWGLTILVEDKDVEKSMILFHDEILDYRENRSNTKRLRIRADELVKACRTSLEMQRSEGVL